VDDTTDVDPSTQLMLGLAGVGGTGKGGVGFQLTNRVMMRLDAGYRFAMTIPMVMSSEGEPTYANGFPIEPADNAPDPLFEQGLLAQFDILYLY
jgi:hypothetical protein